MPQLVKKRRSGWAVLAAGALVASLLAVGSAPAGAAVDTADNKAKTSACVGPALNDQSFTDVSDNHAFKDAINCLAYYGVTNGTGDGSTFSPNDEVTRAQMALFIARAAEMAGVDLGDAMSDAFTDIGDTWAEARDAINKLAAKGVIAKGGAFRPDAAITRAEMATFLVGMLVKASSMVSRGTDGLARVGSGSGSVPDDYFADARSSLPQAIDRDVSVLWELGVTTGASPTATTENKVPLDFNYEPLGTVNRGAMAAFITRALAHTKARPAGVTTQYDGTNVVVSVRDANFKPRPNVVVDVFSTDTNGVALAFRTDGTCGEVSAIDATGTACEIDGTDQITNGDGDASLTISGGIADSGTTVWAWTGDAKAKVKSGTTLYRLDIPKSAASAPATRVRITTDHTGARAKLGTAVVFKVQLQDANGNNVNYGADGKKPAKFLVTLTTTAIVPNPEDVTALIYNPQGATSVVTLPLTTGADGSVSFPVAGLIDPAPTVKADKYKVDVAIQPRPSGNAPAVGPDGARAYFVDAKSTGETPTASGLVNVRVGTTTYATDVGDDATDAVPELFFSTIDARNSKATVTVKPVNTHVAVTDGSNRAVITVTNEYGDPIPGARVFLTSNQTDGTGASTLPSTTTHAGDTVTNGPTRKYAVGSDGSYTVGWSRSATTAATEQIVAVWVYDLDTDGDGSDTAARITSPRTGENIVSVEWATVATANSESAQDIRHVDKVRDRVFVGAAGSVMMLTYDSNDRYNIDPNGAGGSGADAVKPSTYAAFEKSINAVIGDGGDTLTWEIAGSGARAVNTFTLIKPSS